MSARPAPEPGRVVVTITPTIAADLWVRNPDPDGCWRGIDLPGHYSVTVQQARELAGDADYQGNATGDWIDSVRPGLTRAYRRLYAHLRAALAAAGQP